MLHIVATVTETITGYHAKAWLYEQNEDRVLRQVAESVDGWYDSEGEDTLHEAVAALKRHLQA